MQQALCLAEQAERQQEVPVGAVLVHNQQIIAAGHNQPVSANDPSAHAEIIALRAGGKALGNYRLLNTTLYVTLEPCLMCFGAIIHARIARLVYGAHDPKTGVLGSACNALELPVNNRPLAIQGGVLEHECGLILQQFFQKKRGNYSAHKEHKHS